ncbi:MAG: radical SAM protein [Polyangiaceae bacterium]|nr:radical SAM protein [Polyangiaceae bacterium]
MGELHLGLAPRAIEPAPVIDLVLAREVADPPPPAIARLRDHYVPTFYLDVGNVCEVSCRYCCLDRGPDDRFAFNVPLERLIATGASAVARGLARASLIGGEPALRKDLPRLLEGLRGAGITGVTLTTKSARLAAPGYVERLADGGVTLVHLSLDDFDPAVLARLLDDDDAPEGVLASVEALLAEPRIEVLFYAVVTPLNAPNLPRYVERVAEAASRYGREQSVAFSALKPTGRATRHRDLIGMPLRDAARDVQRALQRAAELGLGAMYRGLPPCLMEGWVDLELDRWIAEARLNVETGERALAEIDLTHARGSPCASCREQARCGGPHRTYVEWYGWSEFLPLAQP